MTRYKCKGPVRGWCGHVHRTIEAAAKCLRRDQRQCKAVRGYSDREIVQSNGDPLSEEDYLYSAHLAENSR